MTVAAVILAAQPESALRDVEGVPNARRLADTAWAGGALPIVGVSFDLEGAVAAALAGSPAVLAAPAPREAGPVGQICRGIDVARAEVNGTDAALVWLARWAGSMPRRSPPIEAHVPTAVLRPGPGGGWPALRAGGPPDAPGADPLLMPGPLSTPTSRGRGRPR
jgi:hypothetical protein